MLLKILQVLPINIKQGKIHTDTWQTFIGLLLFTFNRDKYAFFHIKYEKNLENYMTPVKFASSP
jgi:hypothetical protein